MGNINSAREHLYSAIESNNQAKIAHIIKEHPALLNSPMTNDCLSTPLGRASWRGDFKTVELLVCMGADVNYAGPRGIYPLMWAVKSSQEKVVCYLLQNGAKADVKCIGATEQEEFTALEFAIIHGNYECGLILLEQFPDYEQQIRNPQLYYDFARPKQYRYVNYEMFIKHLVQKVPSEIVPNYFKRPEKPRLNDPVIDPREPWKIWIKRVMEFGEPPLVERDDLPKNLQPQNRFMGKVHAYIHNMNPYPKDYNKESTYRDKEKIPSYELSDRANPIKKMFIEDDGKLTDKASDNREEKIEIQI